MIGYACLNESLPDTSIRTTRKANATPQTLGTLIQHNLEVLERLLEYNIAHDIHMFRISSDLIPFASDHAVNTLDWEVQFADLFKRIAHKIRQYKLRVSMHPGQYTVLNSPDEGVVYRSILDLDYHARVMDCLELDATHKLILHIGGVYGDKPAAKERFINTYHTLPNHIKKRLIIENDDRLYTIQDVLEISAQTGAPVVYDNLHNACNPHDETMTDADWLAQVVPTWKAQDGKPKIHYSQQRIGARLGAHTQTIYLQDFLTFYHNIAKFDVDIMLEVKDKNLSAIKCQLATCQQKRHIKYLEQEWAVYKYLILFYSQQHYTAIRQLLKDKSAYPVVSFYQLIESCLDQHPDSGQHLNAIQHMWGYIKHDCSPQEKKRYTSYITSLKKGTITPIRLLNWLYKQAAKYNKSYLTQSLIFHYHPWR